MMLTSKLWRVEQELFTLPGHLGSSLVFDVILVDHVLISVFIHVYYNLSFFLDIRFFFITSVNLPFVQTDMQYTTDYSDLHVNC